MSESELRMYFLDQAESLRELGIQALAYLMQDAQIPDRWEFALSRRLRWVAGFKWTLDECAKTEGVTRERMRQIQKNIENYSLGLAHPPRLLEKVVEIAQKSDSVDSFWADLRSQRISGEQDAWDRESLLELFIRLGNSQLVNQLIIELNRITPPLRQKKTTSDIRESRASLLGFVNLRATSENSDLTSAEVLIALNEMYRFVLGSGNIVLAIGVPPGSFISTISKQLEVNPSATDEDLYEGILRFRSSRKSESMISFQEFSQLLTDIFGTPRSIKNLPSELQVESQFNGCEKAFIEEFKRSTRHSLHRDELVSAAVRSGEKASSAGVWLSTSPIIRPGGLRRGYFQLM